PDPAPAPASEPTAEEPASRPAAKRRAKSKPAPEPAAAPSEPEPLPPPPPPPAPTPAVVEVLDLFGEAPAAAPPPAPVDPAVALADRLAREHAGRTVGFRALAQSLERTDASADDLRRALALLKRAGRAVYKAAQDDAPIEFPTDPVAKPAPTPRKRKPKPIDGGFFPVDGDEE
ncbi:MAG TPA: hypothetical protein VFQ39_15855, partial [Longimicrobium sp.]|nr:hypothetical protein [Longimicrobium sp.]